MNLGPEFPTRRDLAVDRLRGFALFGVLIVNTPFLLTSIGGTRPDALDGVLDVVAAAITSVVFQAKSYVVFAFLFGYSYESWRRQVASRGGPLLRLHVQRHLALAALGAVHGAALFVGDILVVYGTFGLLAYPLWRRSERALCGAAALFYVLQAALYAAVLASPGAAGEDPAQLAALDRAFAESGLVAGIGLRAAVWPHALGLVLGLQGPLVAACACVGVVAARHGWLTDPFASAARWRSLQRVGLALGAPPQLVAAWLELAPGLPERARLAGLVLQYLTAPLLSLGLVALIASMRPSRVAAWAEASGRASLSTYLGGSLVMTALASRAGFGLFGLPTGAAFLTALAVACALFFAGAAWGPLGAGPAERVLRALTYTGARR